MSESSQVQQRRAGVHPEADAYSRLAAARIAGAGAVAILAQYAVDMPEGYFGEYDRMTAFGTLYTAALGILAATSAYGYVRGRQWAVKHALVLLALNVAAFIVPLASDPVIAGATLVWNLFLLTCWLFPLGPYSKTAKSTPAGELDRWLALNAPATRHLTAVSIACTIAAVGYEIGSRRAAQAVCLVLAAIVLCLSWRLLFILVKGGRRSPYIALALVFAALAAHAHPALALAFLGGYQAIILTLLLFKTQVFRDLLDHFYERPAYLILLSFMTIIALGTLFLSFPISSPPQTNISPLDALFTATSAACVTGLVVVDTGTAFSAFGQAILLLLIQIGGLNIMVLSTFASLMLLGKKLGIRGERTLGAVLDLPQPGLARSLIGFIVISTLLLEGVGALCLTYGYHLRGYGFPDALWYGLFHAISAFCNAGFSLHRTSLITFQNQPWILVLIAALITLGGLGFAVLGSVWFRITGAGIKSLSVHVKIVLFASAFLVLAGTAGYAASEWHHTLAGLTPVDKAVNSLFQSVTLRTAGFNSVDFADLQPVSVLFMLAFMFIGASPGGTGGGIKTTTALVLLGSVAAIAKGEPKVTFFRYTLPLETIYRSAAIAVIALLVILIGSGALLSSHEMSFEAQVFEVFSAIGTVGLSLGATAKLQAFGKLVITAIMFLGRIGPLTLALLLAREDRSRIAHPEARVMIG